MAVNVITREDLDEIPGLTIVIPGSKSGVAPIVREVKPKPAPKQAPKNPVNQSEKILPVIEGVMSLPEIAPPTRRRGRPPKAGTPVQRPQNPIDPTTGKRKIGRPRVRPEPTDFEYNPDLPRQGQRREAGLQKLFGDAEWEFVERIVYQERVKLSSGRSAKIVYRLRDVLTGRELLAGYKETLYRAHVKLPRSDPGEPALLEIKKEDVIPEPKVRVSSKRKVPANPDDLFGV